MGRDADSSRCASTDRTGALGDEPDAGTTVAIVGENGAGKSTLVKLLTGMYRPASGRILLDGVDLGLNMSLADGVGAGDLPRIGELPAIDAALERAGAAALAKRLPDGAQTLLGPYVGGRSLSGGEWQRLALARGLMREHPLLVVLDEPTASLDARTEVETGTHDTLLARGGLYAELFELQARHYVSRTDGEAP